MGSGARGGRVAPGGAGAVEQHSGGGREQRGADGDQGDLPAGHADGDDGVHEDRAEGLGRRLVYVRGQWCTQHGRRLVFTSTDLVFDGSKAWNREEDPARPRHLLTEPGMGYRYQP